MRHGHCLVRDENVICCPHSFSCAGWFVRLWLFAARPSATAWDAFPTVVPVAESFVTAIVPLINFPPVSTVWPGFSSLLPVDNFAAIFEAYLTIAADEVYNFTLASDDGSLLNLTDSTGREMKLIENGGDHVMANKSASFFLTAGVYKVCTRVCCSYIDRKGHRVHQPLMLPLHPIQALVFCFENSGPQGLLLHYSSRNIPQVLLPSAIVQPITVVPTPNITGTSGCSATGPIDPRFSVCGSFCDARETIAILLKNRSRVDIEP